jgi:hypothetical protein
MTSSLVLHLFLRHEREQGSWLPQFPSEPLKSLLVLKLDPATFQPRTTRNIDAAAP